MRGPLRRACLLALCCGSESLVTLAGYSAELTNSLLRLDLFQVPGLSTSRDGQRYVHFEIAGTTTEAVLGRTISELALLHAVAVSADRAASFAHFNERRGFFALPWRYPLVPIPAILGINTSAGMRLGWSTSERFRHACDYPRRLSIPASATLSDLANLLTYVGP
jgi:hypothetical protein